MLNNIIASAAVDNEIITCRCRVKTMQAIGTPHTIVAITKLSLRSAKDSTKNNTADE
jgi:hypothetical protein